MQQFKLADDDEWRRTFRIIAAGGLVSGLIAAVLVAIAGGETAALTGLSFGGVTGLAATFTQPADEETPLMSVLLGLGGGAILALGYPTTLVAACFAGAAIGLGISVPESLSEGVRRGLGSAAAFGAGVFTTSVLFESGFLAAADFTGAREPLTGAVWGAFMAAGIGLDQIRVGNSDLLGRLDAAIEDVNERAGRFLRPARELCVKIRGKIDGSDTASVQENAERILEESLRALESLARRGDELREALEAHPAGDLEVRRTSVEAQLESAEGEALQRELEAARAELARQADDRKRLETAIARIDVRQQRCLSALQRLHVHLVEDRGSAESDDRLEQSLEELSHLTEKVQWRNLSVEEICERAEEEADDGAELSSDSVELGTVGDEVDCDATPAEGEGAMQSVHSTEASSEDDDERESGDEARRAAHALDGE